jgi:hypothetical protein
LTCRAVADALAPIADKIKPLVRLLSSDHSGEIVAAARALNRLLKANGADIHAIADGIGRAKDKISEAEMRTLYDAGYQAGLRAGEDKLHANGDPFHNIDGTPPWYEIATWCQRRSDRLGEREQKFIDDMAGRTVWREPTEKQAKWLKSIFHRLGGKVP